MLACGVSPGSSRLPCEALPSDQLTCLPEPLMPANGFSCSRQVMPYFSATRLSVIIIELLMIGREVGGLEDRRDFVLAGATSLCRVLTGMPSLNSSRSTSSMNASTRSGIAPK